ncbi:hypothetical protein CWK15_18085 [Salmonella enterica]|uniref:Ead/Ea22-like family protein n=1 Tax=Salmonella enterica TaxID=28901 RepID=A0A5V4Z6S0_SALER|nr:hypothetical protein [Salmonella enterica]EIU1710390.1 hypothetical protein [Salmonella enterica]
MKCSNGLYFTDRESLAREINNITCYYDLSAELIADAIFNNKEITTRLSQTEIDVIEEYQRQIAEELLTHECDKGQLVSAAISHATLAAKWKDKDPDCYRKCRAPMSWPWSPERWKPTNPRRDMIKGIALLLAEVERQDRLNGQGVSA